jgi:hypothetical protein
MPAMINEIVNLWTTEPLILLPTDPKWTQFQIVTVPSFRGEFVTIQKDSSHKAFPTYFVCPIEYLKTYVNKKGIEKYYKINPSRK